MASLSGSYAKTVDLMDQGKTEEASKEYSENFSPVIKKFYSESAKTYPTQFAKIDKTGNWCDWARDLYVLNGQMQGTFAERQPTQIKAKLEDIRKQFADLHGKTDTQKSNDYIFAFREELKTVKPDAAALKTIMASLDKAAPSVKAKAQADAYSKAKAQWSEQVMPALDKGKLGKKQVQELSKSTDTFYKDFGIQFE